LNRKNERQLKVIGQRVEQKYEQTDERKYGQTIE
jgi:hypothetical protein